MIQKFNAGIAKEYGVNAVLLAEYIWRKSKTGVSAAVGKGEKSRD